MFLDSSELILLWAFYVLAAAAREERNNTTSLTGFDSTVSQSSPPDPVPSGDKQDENFEPFVPPEFHIEEAIKTRPEVEEHLFIAPLLFTSSGSKGEEKHKVDDLVALKNSSDEEDDSVSLHLGEPKLKKQKFSLGEATNYM